MTDERMRALERAVRADPSCSARVELTFARMRARTGYVIAWEGMLEGAPVFWARREREAERLVEADEDATTLPARLQDRGVRKKHGFAVLDLEDAFRLAHRIRVGGRGVAQWQRIPGHGFTIYELASGKSLTGCWPQDLETEFLLEPPRRVRRVSR